MFAGWCAAALAGADRAIGHRTGITAHVRGLPSASASKRLALKFDSCAGPRKRFGVFHASGRARQRPRDRGNEMPPRVRQREPAWFEDMAGKEEASDLETVGDIRRRGFGTAILGKKG